MGGLGLEETFVE